MSDEKREVVVVDVKIRFWSMVILLVKWAIASVPALIILIAIVSMVSWLLSGVLHWNWGLWSGKGTV
jgi:hypothetical protein